MDFSGIKKFFQSRSFIASIILLFVLVIEANLFQYAEIIDLRPQSTHMWRKTDCASFALNYYNDGLNPFTARMHNELNGGGKSLGEGTILYYAVALLYVPFGANELVYRVFWLLLFVIGLIALQQIVLIYLQNLFWSVIISALVFSIPVIAFYAIGFLTNVPSLAFVFIAWYFFLRFNQENKKSFLLWSTLFFLLAGWVKAPALISYLALLGSGFIFLHFIRKESILNIVKTYWILTIPLIFNFGWYSFTSYYAKHGGSDYLSAKLFPFWDLSPEQIEEIKAQFKLLWREDFFSEKAFNYYFVLSCLALPLILLKKIRFFSILFVINLLGFALYILIFFKAFGDHNYYGINPVLLLPLTLIFVLKGFQQFTLGKPMQWVLGVFAIMLLYHNVKFTEQRQWIKYHDWPNETHVSRDLFDIEPQLELAGVLKNDLVISVPDYSPNMSLYLMNRKGVTNFNKLHLSQDSVKKYLNLNYKYIVVNRSEELEQDYLIPFLGEKILQKGEVAVFKAKLP